METAAPHCGFRCAGFIGRWIRCQRPFPAAGGSLLGKKKQRDESRSLLDFNQSAPHIGGNYCAIAALDSSPGENERRLWGAHTRIISITGKVVPDKSLWRRAASPMGCGGWNYGRRWACAGEQPVAEVLPDFCGCCYWRTGLGDHRHLCLCSKNKEALTRVPQLTVACRRVCDCFRSGYVFSDYSTPLPLRGGGG